MLSGIFLEELYTEFMKRMCERETRNLNGKIQRN